MNIKILLFALLLLFCSIQIISGETAMSNFTGENNVSWDFITDGVMGGISRGKIEFLKDNDKSFFRMTGLISTENNGGFIQYRRKLVEKDLRVKNGIEIEVRGNNEIYYVHIRTKGTILQWQYYQASFKTKTS